VNAEDPLAPPDGYGHTEVEADFTYCCTGCGQPTTRVLTLGCEKGEHVGDFGYCLAHLGGPFWCGRCKQRDPLGKVVGMRVLKSRIYDSVAQDKANSALDALFRRKRI
jgi:hypothetical protein